MKRDRAGRLSFQNSIDFRKEKNDRKNARTSAFSHTNSHSIRAQHGRVWFGVFMNLYVIIKKKLLNKNKQIIGKESHVRMNESFVKTELIV